jgi:hypothetical protein
MPGEAELILLGIRAAIRLNEQFRKGFADSTRAAAITIPLPNFKSAPDAVSALTFYLGDGKEFVPTSARVGALVQKAESAGISNLSAEEQSEFRLLFGEHHSLQLARAGMLVTSEADNPAQLTNEDAVTLLSIRQWLPGQDPNPTMLRRLAGVLIEIAVEYFANAPQLVSSTNPRSKALVGFLRAIEPIDFAEGPPEQIVEQMFVAAVEAVRDNPGLAGNDQWAQTLVHDVASTLYTDAKRFVDSATGDLSKQDRIRLWTQLVFRSVLRSAGESVFTHPDTFFRGLNKGESDLVGRVGGAVFGAIVTEEGIRFDHLFTPAALDSITKAALGAVAMHPELVAEGDNRLQVLIGAVAGSLSASSVTLGRDFLPEAVRVILEETGKNLAVLMPPGSDPKKNLLLAASLEVLAILNTPPPPGARWTLRFGTSELQRTFEVAVRSVSDNPDWLVAEAGGARSFMGALIADVLEVVRMKAGPTLRPDSAMHILDTSLSTVSKRAQLGLPAAGGVRPVETVLDAALTKIFDPAIQNAAKWVLQRDESVVRVTRLLLEALVVSGVTPDKMSRATSEIDVAVAKLGQGQPWTFADFQAGLGKALAAGASGGGQA